MRKGLAKILGLEHLAGVSKKGNDYDFYKLYLAEEDNRTETKLIGLRTLEETTVDGEIVAEALHDAGLTADKELLDCYADISYRRNSNRVVAISFELGLE